MRMIHAVCLTSAAMLALPHAAWAESRVAPLPTTATAALFAAAPLGEAELSSIRGGQAPGRLTVGSALRRIDDQARADLRFTGDLGRIEMDVWWGSIGGELVAQSVRASLRP